MFPNLNQICIPRSVLRFSLQTKCELSIPSCTLEWIWYHRGPGGLLNNGSLLGRFGIHPKNGMSFSKKIKVIPDWGKVQRNRKESSALVSGWGRNLKVWKGTRGGGWREDWRCLASCGTYCNSTEPSSAETCLPRPLYAVWSATGAAFDLLHPSREPLALLYCKRNSVEVWDGFSCFWIDSWIRGTFCCKICKP